MMKKVVMVIAVSAIFMLAGCTKVKTVTMNMNEVVHDIETNMDKANYSYYGNFKSLNPGDTLIIDDTIKNITYNAQYNATMISFSSNDSARLYFKGDLENNFQNGEKVNVKLHIIEDKFTTSYQGHTWNIDLETYREGWNSQNHTQKLLPPDVIYSISGS